MELQRKERRVGFGYMNLDLTETSPVEGVVGMYRVTESVKMGKVIRISRPTVDKKFED